MSISVSAQVALESIADSLSDCAQELYEIKSLLSEIVHEKSDEHRVLHVSNTDKT